MERMLITKLKRTSATQAELFAPRHRYADLRLFDLSELSTIGIDYEALPIGEERPARFYALWVESEKVSSTGRPYKDIVGLERIDGPATTSSVDNSAVLGELRAIKALLRALLVSQGADLPAVQAEEEPPDQDPDLEAVFPRQYLDGSELSANEAERAAFADYVAARGHSPEDVQALRQWVTASRRGQT
jgi:hypothetical protein